MPMRSYIALRYHNEHVYNNHDDVLQFFDRRLCSYIESHLGEKKLAKGAIEDVIGEYVRQNVTPAFARKCLKHATLRLYGTEEQDMSILEDFVETINATRGHMAEIGFYTGEEMREKLERDEEAKFNASEKKKAAAAKKNGKKYKKLRFKDAGLDKLRATETYQDIKDDNRYFRYVCWSPFESTRALMAHTKRVTCADAAHREAGNTRGTQRV